MRPRKRYLKGNKGTEGPTSLLFFDSESWMRPADRHGLRTAGTLRLWTAAYVRRDGDVWRKPIYHRGHTCEEFWSMVERHSSWSRPLWAFAHNLRWDLTQLDFWSELERWRWTAGPVERPPNPDTGKERAPWRGRLCLENRPTFLIVRGSRGTLRLVDTGNYWPTSLEQIGEKFGIGKMAKPDFDGPEGPLFTYCERDTDVCRVAVCELLKWWLKEGCGVFKMTAPSLAFTHFQHTCDKRAKDGTCVNIVLEDESPSRALEREAYLGARIEPFYIGRIPEKVYHLDVNSLYPFVMQTNLYPRCRKDCVSEIPPAKLANKMHAYGAIANVRINTGPDLDTYPVRRPGVQIHACGRFDTALCGPELRRALDRGHVETVRDAYLYSMADLFGTWCAGWLDRKVAARERGDVGESEFCKLILVSLYGKFGQRSDWWIDDPSRAPRRSWGRTFRHSTVTGKDVEWRYVAAHVQRREAGHEPANAFPAIAAYVTSNAREYMRGIFGLMPERSLLYTATDSIICTERGFKRLSECDLIHPTEPGKLRLEASYSDSDILGANWYRIGSKWKCSGHWGRARQQPDGRFVCDRWDGMETLMQQNPRGECGFTTIPVLPPDPRQKNADAGDGWRVPFRLSPDDDFTDRPVSARSRYHWERLQSSPDA